MSIKQPYHQTLIEAWKLAEQSRKQSGLFAPRKPEDLFEVTKDGRLDRSRFRVRKYKVTMWLSAPLYVDVLRQKAAERHTGSLYKFLTLMLERAVPPTAPRPEPRQAKTERVLEATKLRNGHVRTA